MKQLGFRLVMAVVVVVIEMGAIGRGDDFCLFTEVLGEVWGAVQNSLIGLLVGDGRIRV